MKLRLPSRCPPMKTKIMERLYSVLKLNNKTLLGDTLNFIECKFFNVKPDNLKI